jgi:methyl-accepting chemotaxis protein
LANVTIQAVDQLGNATSEEIERTADEIMRGAAEIADKLRELADAIKQHAQIASEQVAGFCGKATSVFESVIELRENLLANGPELEAEKTHEETLTLPKFIANGPAEPGNGER